MDVFPALLEADVSFYVHEFDDYWNDIGSLDEYRQGNFDALDRRRRAAVDGEEVAEGIVSADGPPATGAELTGPVLIGRDCEIGAGSWLHGPLVIGDGARIGAGSRAARGGGAARCRGGARRGARRGDRRAVLR